MRRREFVNLIGGAAAWPLAARAQQDGRVVRRVGALISLPETDPQAQPRFAAFRQGLADLGWVEGRNLRLDVRWSGPEVARQRSYAHELVALAPEAILATSTPVTQALRGATQTIPIVFVTISDPIATGIVSNLARPEANVTGFMQYEYSMAGKWLSLLKDMAPRLARVLLLYHPDVAAAYASFYVQAAEVAGERLALKIAAAGVRDAAEIETAVAAIASSGDSGLLALPGASIRPGTIAAAAKYRVPAIYSGLPAMADDGLISYGADSVLLHRDGATYVDRILRGAKVSELPVQFSTKFKLVINLKTAKALGLNVSQQLQFLADEVIE